MTTISTTSTFELRERATAAVAAGHEYVFVAPDGFRIKIGYVAGGGFVRVEARTAAGILDATRTLTSVALTGALQLFREWVTAHATRPPAGDGELTEYARGAQDGCNDAIIHAAGVLAGHILTALDADDLLSAGLLRTARRAIVALLDHEEK